MPFGLPVEPEVYMTNSGCSASKNSQSCSVEALPTTSCHHTSRPSFHSTSCPVRLTTSTERTSGHFCSASSTAGFSADGAPRRYPPSAVMTTRASQSMIRSDSAVEEKPPNTTVCGAPSRAHASIATTVSGIIGM